VERHGIRRTDTRAALFRDGKRPCDAPRLDLTLDLTAVRRTPAPPPSHVIEVTSGQHASCLVLVGRCRIDPAVSTSPAGTSGIPHSLIRSIPDQESSILSAFLRYFNDVTTNAVQNSCGRGASVGPRTPPTPASWCRVAFRRGAAFSDHPLLLGALVTMQLLIFGMFAPSILSSC